MTTATLAIDSRNQLGEGILWCDRARALWWVDITGARLWRHHPGSGDARSWPMPQPLACIALTDSGRLLLGLAKGLHLTDIDMTTPPVDGSTLSLQPLAEIEADNSHTRLNDGRADRFGGFVFGTKNERGDAAKTGAFYRWHPQHGLHALALPGAWIPNSIGFSPDGRTMYFCDSPERRILYCDYDERGAASSPRLFATIDAPGEPDGCTVDAEGHPWSAQWAAGRVVRYRPDGTIERIVSVPVENPSCCALADDALYITSAREGMSEAALSQSPQAGGVFVAALERAFGLPESRVAL
ncbi:SMP-30/gluconolactonase/LRE family protein [Lysobacter cavernae]|uniref:SMP-30/gluconolactonase/LRE family protein n=1 Tax=Lysobacter cavernae TaxID=1685901 RepID=A0ABV7RLY0_9GAMM